MNSKQTKILAEAYKEGMSAATSDIHVDGQTKEVWITKTLEDAEMILQPDGSLSIVGEGITILIRSTDPVPIPDEPTIERIGGC